MLVLLRQYWTLLNRPARLQAMGLVAVALVTSIAEGVGVGLIFPLIKIVLDPQFIQTNSALHRVYDTFGFGSTRAFTLAAIVGLFVLIVAKNALSFYNVVLQNRFVFRNEARSAVRLLNVYLHTPYVRIMGTPSADLLNNANHRVTATYRDGMLAMISIFTEGFSVLTIAAILAAANPTVGLLTASLLAVGIGTFYLAFRGQHIALGKRDQANNLDNFVVIQQSFGVAREARVLGRQSFFIERFRQVRDRLGETHLAFNALSQLPRMAIETVAIGSMLAVMLVMVLGQKDVAEFMAIFALFVAAAFRLMPSASKFVYLLGQIRRSRLSTELVVADLERWESAADAAADEHGAAPLPLRRNIRIEDVSFTYPGADRPVIDHLSLEIARGESVALVGPSGGGKSTLVDMLLGLLPPTAGRITVDGADIAGNLAGWRRQIGYVPQMSFLVDDTVRRNIALGIRDEEIDEARIARAIRLAQLDRFIAELPDGLDTRIGELGTRISGGQRQRVAIARALYAEPSVLILDEATSSLDNVTEA